MMRTAMVVSVFVVLASAGCGSAPAAGGRPPAESPAPQQQTEIAIPEAESENAADDEPVPVVARGADAEISGDWTEDWPNRGGCADSITIDVRGSTVQLSGTDCNDGEAYEYSEARIDGRTLKFKLRVKSTDRMLHYELTLGESGELIGPVTGGAEATVTWRRVKR